MLGVCGLEVLIDKHLMNANIRRPEAFLSCSLRPEDRSFVNFVAKLTRAFGFIPCKTVGLYSAAPRPLWMQMRDGVASTDCVIVAAIPRYVEQDIRDKNKSRKSISEMLHVECGLAVAFHKPILVFVSEGTDVGAFLPTVTQYIELKQDRVDFRNQYPLIRSYFINAYQVIQQLWQAEDRKHQNEDLKRTLAVVGVGALIKLLFGDDA